MSDARSNARALMVGFLEKKLHRDRAVQLVSQGVDPESPLLSLQVNQAKECERNFQRAKRTHARLFLARQQIAAVAEEVDGLMTTRDFFRHNRRLLRPDFVDRFRKEAEKAEEEADELHEVHEACLAELEEPRPERRENEHFDCALQWLMEDVRMSAPITAPQRTISASKTVPGTFAQL
ncbi:F-UL14 [Chelonid alphaherpesvirus 5]|uniref:F-UL14 n=1 Tax=Chelonid alphaherpesvirus 5 TaxID=702736 RepID=V5NXD4_9ALPH|nr:F-UL14 [Chelonid alphaherpesvirus 5]AHA93334.1 F-UL14 [Chelonid alphaherpesvirus 5]